jgi:hypothetical protein
VTFESKLIAYVVLLLACIGGLWLFVHHERQIGAERVTAEVAKATAAKAAEDERETVRRVQAQAEIAHDATVQADAARAGAAAADRAAASLRVQLNAFVANARAAHPAPTAASEAGDPIGVLATLLGSADDFAGRVAAEADANRIAGDACVRAYDSLTVTP